MNIHISHLLCTKTQMVVLRIQYSIFPACLILPQISWEWHIHQSFFLYFLYFLYFCIFYFCLLLIRLIKKIPSDWIVIECSTWRWRGESRELHSLGSARSMLGAWPDSANAARGAGSAIRDIKAGEQPAANVKALRPALIRTPSRQRTPFVTQWDSRQPPCGSRRRAKTKTRKPQTKPNPECKSTKILHSQPLIDFLI